MNCKYCGKELTGKEKPKNFCCYACYENWTKWNKEPNCECAVCKTKFYLKPSRIKSCKNGVCCSRECSDKYRSIWFSGDKNHQYGLKGSLNSSFKGVENSSKNNTIIDIWVYKPEHPHANKYGRVTKHRLVVEENYTLFDPKFFETINNIIVLKKEYQVHHKDGNHNNDEISNLEVLTRSEHTSIHNKEKTIIRDPTNGRIMGVVKEGELLENPTVEDNQQPSTPLTKCEGSETNS